MKGELTLEYKTGDVKIDNAGRKYLDHDREILDVQDVSAQGAFLVIKLKRQTIFMPAERIHRANFIPADPEPLAVIGMIPRG